MQACERLVEGGLFVPSKPAGIIESGYSHLRRLKEVKGSSTACVVVLSRKDGVLYCANLGDSGFVVLREGQIVHRSKEQTHGFNTPYQLGCPPAGEVGLCDRFALIQ
jgi:protein phosphatase PTC7